MTHRSMTKLIKIYNALLTQTKQGRLTWVPTEKLDVFEVDFPDYSIRIVPGPDEMFHMNQPLWTESP